MQKKIGYIVGAGLFLVVAVYGVLMALDVQFLIVLQVQDTVGAQPPSTFLLRSDATATPAIPALPVPTPPVLDQLPELITTAVPSALDQILDALGIDLP